jgi:hypothetical protein
MLLLEAPIRNQNFKARAAIFVVQNAAVDAAVTFVIITPAFHAAAPGMQSDRFLELHRGHRIEMGLEGRAR